jgi:hypothetical protein
MILSKVRAKASFTVSVEIARLLHLMLFRIDNKVFNKLFLTFITKFIPSLSKVLLILQIFWPELKKLLDVIFAHSRSNVHLFGVVKVRPQSFFPQSDNPDPQVVVWILVYPFRRFYYGLAWTTVSCHKVDGLLKSLVVCRVCHEWKEWFCILNQVTMHRNCVIFLFIRCDASELDNWGHERSYFTTFVCNHSKASVAIFLSLNSFENWIESLEKLALTSSYQRILFSNLKYWLFSYAIDWKNWRLLLVLTMCINNTRH